MRSKSGQGFSDFNSNLGYDEMMSPAPQKLDQNDPDIQFVQFLKKIQLYVQ